MAPALDPRAAPFALLGVESPSSPWPPGFTPAGGRPTGPPGSDVSVPEDVTAQSSTSSAASHNRDDRILPEARWVARAIVPVLALAFLLLYIWPDRTTELFAWTIRPDMTPLLMGAGYIGGAYFFLRAALASRWHHVAVGFPPVATFASFMTVATVLHWDRFNHSHPAFVVWVALYATTPFVVFAVWLRNRSTDPGTPDLDDVVIPDGARALMAAFGALILLTGVLLFLVPQAAIGVWPWKLSPLTAQVGGGWFALPGVLWLGIAADRRWSAARIALESQAISIVLILLGVARAWGDYDPSYALTWVFVGGMAVLLAIAAGVYLRLEVRRRNAATDQPA